MGRGVKVGVGLIPLPLGWGSGGGGGGGRGLRCGVFRWGCSGGGVFRGVQVREGAGFRWRGWLFRGGGVQWGRGAKGQTLGGLKGSNGQTLGGELNGIFLQFEFSFRNALSRTVALQSFSINHLINAEILAKFCTTRETKTKWKKIHFNVISYLQ